MKTRIKLLFILLLLCFTLTTVGAIDSLQTIMDSCSLSQGIPPTFSATDHLSTVEATPIYLDTLTSGYERLLNTEQRKSGILVLLLFLLLLLLVGALFYINQLKNKGKEFKVISNNDARICEEYVGGFLEISLQYIHRFEEYQRFTKRKILAGQSNDLLKESFYDREKDEEELYRKFDQTFLGLFPNFVVEVNTLFKPGEKFVAKEGEPLSTDLRILALYRLGVYDSNKIASFLHYSLRTIYNYKSQLRKRLIDETVDLENEVRKIG